MRPHLGIVSAQQRQSHFYVEWKSLGKLEQECSFLPEWASCQISPRQFKEQLTRYIEKNAHKVTSINSFKVSTPFLYNMWWNGTYSEILLSQNVNCFHERGWGHHITVYWLAIFMPAFQNILFYNLQLFNTNLGTMDLNNCTYLQQKLCFNFLKGTDTVILYLFLQFQENQLINEKPKHFENVAIFWVNA